MYLIFFYLHLLSLHKTDSYFIKFVFIYLGYLKNIIIYSSIISRKLIDIALDSLFEESVLLKKKDKQKNNREQKKRRKHFE